jgi:molybdopterin converting factor small subunit
MIKISVRGEPEFGLPGEFMEVELSEPTLDNILDHFKVNPKIRKHLLPIVNNKMSKFDNELSDGDEIILQSPYSGG